MREIFGDENQALNPAYYSFWTACRCAANSSTRSPRHRIPDHPLNGVVIGIASNESRRTRVFLPQEDEIARLKKVLQTDAEPKWLPVS